MRNKVRLLKILAAILVAILIILIIYFLYKENILFQPAGLTIAVVTPNIIYNSQPNIVTIYGTGFTEPFSLNLIVGGSSFPLDPQIYNPEWISPTEIRLNFPAGLPAISGEISVTDSFGAESNPYPFENKDGVAPLNPQIVQVTPINLQNPLDLAALPVRVWGNNFDSNSKVILDGVDLTSRVLSRDDKKIEIYLTKAEMLEGKQVRVENEGNVRSNTFNINETTIKYPDLIHMKDSVVFPGDNIEIFGNNFFASNSKLYVDDAYVDPSSYVLTQTPTGNFKITLNSNSYSIGPHKIYFDNPPRYPNQNYNYGRLKSNKLYFEIKNIILPDQTLENDKIKIIFDGDSGNIKRIENKDTGYSHNIQNVFPWRMIFRKINSTSHVSRDNLMDNSIFSYDQDLFNPFKGGCNNLQFSTEIQPGLQILSVTWPGCEIDSNNRFDFVQKFFLEPDKAYFETNFSMVNVDVLNYSIDTVMIYATILEDPSVSETAIIVDRVHETIREPGFNILTRGSRNLCPGFFQPLTEGQIPCGFQGQENVMSYADIGIDGEGPRTNAASWLDFWMGYWNQNGDYLYGIAVDNFTYSKGYSYQGEEGAFKNSAWILFPDNFDYGNFNYKMPYSFRIGVGKGTTFTGDETWINIADRFKEIQQSRGMIKTPFELRGLSDHVNNLDITTSTSLGAEFFENIGGVLQIRANPNIAEIADLYEESRKFFGAEESTILVWGGDQDDTQGYGKFAPIPGISFPFYEAMNLAGWNPCFYTMNAGFYVRGDEPELPGMIADGELLEFDPTGDPSIIPYGAPLNANSFANLAPGSVGLGPTDNSYLKFFLEKYRVMNNNNKGTRCFYSDGLFTATGWSNGGPRSRKYDYRGYDDKALTSIREFFNKEFEELKNIDAETYSIHEGSSQLTTNQDLFPFQPAASGGTGPQTYHAGTNYKNGQQTQFYQRVYGGYIDFLLSNELADPNRLALIHIPTSYLPTLKAIPGVAQDYDKTLEETYLLPGWVGFLYKSAVPYYNEVAVDEASGYTPINRLSDVSGGHYSQGAGFEYWVEPLEQYAESIKEQVNARQLARNYFHGLWHLPINTNSPEEEYYYISDWLLFSSSKEGGAVSAKFPRVINSVRQALVGNDWGQRFGLMFINTYSREPSQTVDFAFEFDRYGLIPGQQYNLFKYSKENGREYIRTVSGDFTHSLTIPSRTFVLLELEIDGDGDSDGVVERYDVCPNTPSSHAVNPSGCPAPLTNEFSPTLTTNLVQSTNLLRQTGLSIGVNNFGKIDYTGQEVRLLRFNGKTQSLDRIDLEKAIEITLNKISVNTVDYPELDQTARITFEGLTYSQTPILTVQTTGGYIPCSTSQCQIESYDSSTGRLTALVAGFSNYSTQASGTIPSPSSGSSSGSSGSSGSTGSPILPQCSDNIDNDGDGLVDYPADPGCTNRNSNIEIDAGTTPGTNNIPPIETETPNEEIRFRVIFWIVLVTLVSSIIIVSLKIVKMFRMNSRFKELSDRRDNLNNEFNAQQDLLSNNPDNL